MFRCVNAGSDSHLSSAQTSLLPGQQPPVLGNVVPDWTYDSQNDRKRVSLAHCKQTCLDTRHCTMFSFAQSGDASCVGDKCWCIIPEYGEHAYASNRNPYAKSPIGYLAVDDPPLLGYPSSRTTAGWIADLGPEW